MADTEPPDKAKKQKKMVQCGYCREYIAQSSSGNSMKFINNFFFLELPLPDTKNLYHIRVTFTCHLL